MTKKVKTAVIGVGNMGENHARIYSKISNLIAVADLDPQKGKLIANKYKCKFYHLYQQMLDQEKPQAVSVVVPTEFHKKIAIDCLKKKIPVLVEKPIAKSFSAAQEMLKEAKKNKTFLMPGHIERFNPAVIKLKQLIDQKRVGRIINLLAVRVGISPPRARKSDVVLDLATHDVDIFNYLLNDFPLKKKIIKHQLFPDNLADSASILLEYPITTAIIQTNWITPIKIRKLYLTGAKGFAKLDYINQKLVLYDKLSVKKVFVSKKEPLKQELLFFLKNIKNFLLLKMTKQAIMAIKILS